MHAYAGPACICRMHAPSMLFPPTQLVTRAGAGGQGLSERVFGSSSAPSKATSCLRWRKQHTRGVHPTYVGPACIRVHTILNT